MQKHINFLGMKEEATWHFWYFGNLHCILFTEWYPQRHSVWLGGPAVDVLLRGGQRLCSAQEVCRTTAVRIHQQPCIQGSREHWPRGGGVVGRGLNYLKIPEVKTNDESPLMEWEAHSIPTCHIISKSYWTWFVVLYTVPNFPVFFLCVCVLNCINGDGF